MIQENLLAWLTRSIQFGTVIMYGSLGEILTEKSGNLNLGVPGIMYLGAFAGFASVFTYEKNNPDPSAVVCVLLGLFFAFLASALGGLIYSFLTITLRANQNVTGLALTTFGTGVANFMCTYMFPGVYAKAGFANAAFKAKIPVLSDRLGIFGQIFFSYDLLVYLAIITAVILHLYISKTRSGLNLRAVGENPATADAAGVNVTRHKYLATVIGAGISGMGGLYYVVTYNDGIWATTDEIAALGWLAVALVIFTTWRPLNAVWGAYLFGTLYWLYNFLPKLLGATNTERTASLYQMLPYLVTIIVLVAVSLRRRRESQPPASLGLAYFREER